MANSSFISKILWLFSGLFLAQLINTGFAFVLPRIYQPADFADFGVFLATVLILFEVNNFKLDYALMLPKEEKESIALFKKAVFYGGYFALGLLVLSVIYRITPFKNHIDFWFWIPLSVFLNGIYQPTLTYLNKIGKYPLINISRILQAVVTGMVACLPLVLETSSVWLIQGFVAGQLIALLVVAKLSYHLLQTKVNVEENVLRQYSSFPKYGTWSSLLNTFSRNAVFYLLHYFFSPTQVGFYTFTNRLVQAPLGMVTSAIGQAYFRDASQAEQPSQVAELTQKLLQSLSALALIPALLGLLWGPQLFSLFFGEDWRGAGEVARWLALWYGTSLVVTPLSMLVDVKGLLKWELHYNIVFLIFRVGVLVLGGLSGNFGWTLGLFCGIGVIFNIYLLKFVLKIARDER